MSATADHRFDAADPTRLTIRYADNPDGWITAQIMEYPAAISEGPDRHAAYLNVIEALHDLTHEPTPAERALIVTEQAFLTLQELLESAVAAAREGSRDIMSRLPHERVH